MVALNGFYSDVVSRPFLVLLVSFYPILQIFNSSLYNLAKEEIEKPKTLSPLTYGLYRFLTTYRDKYTGVYELANLMKTHNPVLRQMIYPNATQYACALKIFKDTRLLKVCKLRVVCVLNKSAPDNYEIERNACEKGGDCTYLKPANCVNPLCYADLQGTSD
ncbi:hypothetical protein RB195_004402 [Necator americanus]|uniref:Uncharacterized protein n=1 Tax=Necator americanus TaxID=51031 RepID=A0ABR1BHS7_NECAM